MYVVALFIKLIIHYSWAQCSEPSSPSVLGVGPDGPLVVVRLFLSPRPDYGIWSWDRTP